MIFDCLVMPGQLELVYTVYPTVVWNRVMNSVACPNVMIAGGRV